MKGTIFNIQKFCLHDGPGIRTTVFFKGCNLRCRWCANPESQQMLPQLTLNREKCTGCARCEAVCPAGARKVSEGVCAVDPRSCLLCGACITECPAQAIGREGRSVTVEEVLAEVVKDAPFYARSGGGVTFSGGEPLLQPEFAAALARAIRREGISVAIETAGAVDNETFRSILPLLDFVYMDLKHHDPARHREGTGVGNEQVLENLRTLRDSGVEFMPRIPVIPGFNDSPADAQGFARLLAASGIHRVQLLPFHQLGEQKYALLGWDYVFSGARQLHREDLEGYRQVFTEHGVDAQF